VEARPCNPPARPANAVNEVFRHLRQIVVDHVSHVIAVQASRRDVGCDQHLIAAFLKSAQRGVALRLRAIAVNHGRRKAIALQFLGQPLRAALGAGEDQVCPFSS
jgi:hypothetical protein